MYLKEVLQQAKCYVRPIQRDIPIAMQGTCTSLMGTASVKVRLHNFDALFLFGKGILGYGGYSYVLLRLTYFLTSKTKLMVSYD